MNEIRSTTGNRPPDLQDEINKLQESLGFTPTAEMLGVAIEAIKALAAGTEEGVRLLSHYAELGEALVLQKYGEESAKAQLGLMIDIALLKAEAGFYSDYIDDIVAAISFADGAPPLQYALDILRRMRDEAKEVPVSALAKACRSTITEDDYQTLLLASREEALDYAIALLTEAGIEDPDSYLDIRGVL